MFTRSLLAALAVGLLSVVSAASEAQAGSSGSAPLKNQLPQHVSEIGGKTVARGALNAEAFPITAFSSQSRRSGPR